MAGVYEEECVVVMLIERFTDKYKEENECWLWTASVNQKGYGNFWYGGTMGKAHRYAYENLVEEIPDGHDVHHTCKNRHCVNPDHLRCMSKSEHGYESSEWQRKKESCPKGHPYSGDNLALHGKRKARVCKKCNRDRTRQRRAEEHGNER